jgi:hypothetical protein
VTHLARILLIALMLAAVPLRGYAGTLMLFCGSHESAASPAAGHAHEHDGEAHVHADDAASPHSHEGDDHSPHATSACSVCASCCTGAILVSDAVERAPGGAPDAAAIPFLAHPVPDFIPGQLDRPPASL